MQHGVTQVEIRRRRIEADLDDERLTGCRGSFQFHPQIGGAHHVHAPAGEVGELIVDGHKNGRCESKAPYSERMPPAASGSVSRRAVLKGLAAIGIGTATGTVAHGFLYERHHVDVTRTAIASPGFPNRSKGCESGS